MVRGEGAVLVLVLVLWREEVGRGTRGGVEADPVGVEMLRCGGKGWLEDDPSLVVRLAAGTLPGIVWRRVRAGLEVALSGMLLDADQVLFSVSRMSLRDVLVPRVATCHGEACGRLSF